MTVYIDAEYRCHVQAGEGMKAVEAAFFDGKCGEFIEGYRFIPAGEAWTRGDGTAICGETAVPFRLHTTLEAAQREHERERYERAEAELAANAGVYAAAYEEGVQSA